MTTEKRIAATMIATALMLSLAASPVVAAGKGMGPEKARDRQSVMTEQAPDAAAGEEETSCLPLEPDGTAEEETAVAETCAPAEDEGDAGAQGHRNLNQHGRAGEKNPNVDADGNLAPGKASHRWTEQEAEGYIAQVKEQSRERARFARQNGARGAYLVYVNGEYINMTPAARGGRTLVPFRQLAELLGAEVDWEPSTRTVIMVKDGVEIYLPIGEGYAIVNGETIELEAPPELIDDRTYVPLRFIAEALGADVDWDPETGAITVITLPDGTEVVDEDGSTDEGTTDEGATDEGATDEGATDEGATDEGSTDEGTTDEGTTDEGTTDEGTTDEGTTDEGTTDEGTTDEGTVDEGTTDEGTTDGTAN